LSLKSPLVLIWVFICIFCFAQRGYGQSYSISGRVTDANTGEPVPYANVYVPKTSTGTATDFEGFYKLTLKSEPDSLWSATIGFLTRKRKVSNLPTQIINFQLEPSSLQFNEVVIRPGENPAWEVMRRMVAAKDINDKSSLSAYEYESYNRSEIDADNLSEKFQKRNLVRRMKAVMDSIQIIRGEDGKAVLPIYISETIKAVYKRNSPNKTKEKIIKQRTSGIGIEPTSVLNQLITSSLQDYNFYKNWLDIFSKLFVSPLADGWKFYYDYDLKDSVQVGDDFCYKIDFFPKRPQDLAFIGSIWITKNGYALKQINCRTGEKANINFIEKFSIQQELYRLPEGTWLPSKNRVLVNVSQPTKNTAGMLAKFYTSNKNFLINQPRPLEFYVEPIEKMTGYNQSSDQYWDAMRHDSLSRTERNVYKMIDTVRRLPVVRSYVEVANIAVNGYKRWGAVDVGPYIYTYTSNNVEGSRVRLGFKTNSSFSNKFTYRGYLAYGTKDQRFKYESSGEYLFSRRHWTVLGTRYKEDLELLALYDNAINANNLFNAFARFGSLTNSRPFYVKEVQTYFSSEFAKGFTVGAVVTTRDFQFNTGKFDFKYFPVRDGKQDTLNTFKTADITLEFRIAPNEQFLENQNSRISMGGGNLPIFNFKYIHGFNGFGRGNFDYSKFQFNIVQWLKLGYLGQGRYSVDFGYIPNTLPYPLLRPHLGNQTPFHYVGSFNQMRFFEFVSDRWLQLGYQQYFEGFLFNSIPKVRNWNLRLLATGNLLYGSVSEKNYTLGIDPANPGSAPPFSRLEPGKPYAEVGYGIENIARVGRIDFIHRLNYLDKPNVKPFGIKVSVQFQL